MRIAMIVGVSVLVAAGGIYWFFIGSSAIPPEESFVAEKRTPMNERVEIKTQDGVSIVGDYYPPVGEMRVVNGASRGVILLHMMPSDRKSWTVFAKKLQQAGLPSLAVDLRGHGESRGGPEGYKSFSDVEHQNSRLDITAAALFLRSKKVDEFHLVGASIGANLALQYAAEHPNASSIVILSPGLDYRGVKTEKLIQQLRPGTGVYLVASDEDSYSRDTVNKLAAYINLDDLHRLKIFTGVGHGTTVLENHPEFMDELVGWLRKFN